MGQPHLVKTLIHVRGKSVKIKIARKKKKSPYRKSGHVLNPLMSNSLEHIYSDHTVSY